MDCRVLYVRHGESEHHVQGLMGGWTDTPLTSIGRRQAQAAAERLASMGVPPQCPLFASDLQRTRQTADILAARLNLTVTPLPDLREIHVGVATNLSVAEAESLLLPPSDNFDPEWRGYEGAESLSDLWRRLADAEALMRGHDTCLIAGHGFSGMVFIARWLGLSIEQRISFQLDPGSISELALNEWGERQLVRLNVTR